MGIINHLAYVHTVLPAVDGQRVRSASLCFRY